MLGGLPSACGRPPGSAAIVIMIGWNADAGPV